MVSPVGGMCNRRQYRPRHFSRRWNSRQSVEGSDGGRQVGACRPSEGRFISLADLLVGFHIIDIRVTGKLPEFILASVVVLQLENITKILLDAGPRRCTRAVPLRAEEGLEGRLGCGKSTLAIINLRVRSWIVPNTVDHVRYCHHLGVAYIRQEAFQIIPRVAGISLLSPPGKTLVAKGILKGMERDTQTAEVL